MLDGVLQNTQQFILNEKPSYEHFQKTLQPVIKKKQKVSQHISQ